MVDRNTPAISARTTGLEIAIIGMAGRFPGAKNVEELWRNLRDGVESISFFSDEELESSGIDPAVLSAPKYVKAGGVLEDIELFDASFFGFSPREAEITDPQHRLFLECAWEAVENAGYNVETYHDPIGVFAGAGMSTYLIRNLYPNRDLMETAGGIQIKLGNDKDQLTTRVSYKLNLRGPSVAVQTSCSTSLVAVHLACQDLLSGECDMALAGGVSINVPQKAGYLYQEGGIDSPDGHCRAFDARAQGTVDGNGVGVVVLKRLADALAAGDCILAIIKGSAINNDGALKVAYTAPSVDGQAKAIRAAQMMAEVEAETITYIEAHGTGTPLGDPIEIAALTQAFRESTRATGFCAIGSVKTNIGHLNAASGATGLIKTVLALRHRMLPPSLHFNQPNPQINFADTPFYVNTALSEWQAGKTPRRAGVSSFGIGGTNAHLILEEAPVIEDTGASRSWQLLVLSAKTPLALESASAALVEHLERHPTLNLADAAYTLQVGRCEFGHRRALVCHDTNDAVHALATGDPRRVLTSSLEVGNRPVAFLFPGLGDHYVNMASQLYQVEPAFREQIDRCSELLKTHLGLDVRSVLYPDGVRAGEAVSKPASTSTPPHLGPDLRRMLRFGEDQVDEATQKLNQTSLAQPALFAIEYALAQLWREWGVLPRAMIGYSLGEYVAACLAGVLSLEDALALVSKRAQLIQGLPGGAMLAVPLSENEVKPLLGKELSLSAINGPALCVVSGPIGAVSELEHRLAENGLACRRLQTTHAFHSKMMEPIVEPFIKLVKTFNLRPPQIPYVSNVTGSWITAAAATDPSYWARHLCQTVRFADGIRELWEDPDRILLEVGPGQTLGSLALQHPASGGVAEPVVLPSLRGPYDRQQDVAFLLSTLGKLWLRGAHINWPGFHAHERCRRLPLPTYPFERRRYWIEPQEARPAAQAKEGPLKKEPDIAHWIYVPIWKQSMPLAPSEQREPVGQKGCLLVFVDGCGLGSELVKRLEQAGRGVVAVVAGERFARLGDHSYTVNPGERESYDTLLKELGKSGKTPTTIVHLWSATPDRGTDSGFNFFEASQDTGFYSLLFLAQALARQNLTNSLQMIVVSSNLQDVTGEEELCPEKATLLGPCKVIPQEYPNITCRSIDVVVPRSETSKKQLIEQLVAELATGPSDLFVAYRGHHRWVQTFETVPSAGATEGMAGLRERGVYLITGGLGGIGPVLAEYLAQSVQAKLILNGRSSLPGRDEWWQWLATHDEQDSISRRIRRVQALEELGAEVLVLSADVADQEQMEAVIAQVHERFGKIHGVIHAAAVAREKAFCGVQEVGKAESELHFQPKVRGLYVLEEVLQGEELDFCLLQSSLSSVLGGLGFSAYSAANLFMDAFAHKHRRGSHVPWISVNWDSWRLEEEHEQNAAAGATLAELYLTKQEGVRAFQRVLSVRRVPQVVVSTGNLQARIDQWIKIESLRDMKDSERASLPLLHQRPNLLTAYVVPRDQTEQALAAIWQELLGIEQVGIYDNFFEMGGHSLLAVRLAAMIQKQFGQNLPLSTLFQGATIEHMAGVLRQEANALPWSTLVWLRRGGAKQPFFYVHPVGGHALCYIDLARHLDLDQPVCGLQARGLDGEQEPNARVEDMAAHYIKTLRDLQPHGPYLLGGWSFGGLIAFEMAQQLHRQGQEVALLALLDSNSLSPGGKVVDDSAIMRSFAQDLARQCGEDLLVSLDTLRRLSPDEQLHYILEQAIHANILPSNVGVAQIRHLLNVFQANVKAMLSYLPQVYQGRLILFLASEERKEDREDPAIRWKELAAGGVEEHIIPGDHYTIMREPRVQVLANRLRTYLTT